MKNKKYGCCISCGKVQKLRTFKKINKKLYCLQCYSLKRKEHRKKTIESSGIKEELKNLKKKYNYLYRIEHKAPNTRIYTKRTKKHRVEPLKSFYEPFIKAPATKKKPKYNSGVTLEEKRILLRIIMSKGLNFEDAVKRVNKIIIQQTKIRNRMKEQGKNEIEIKVKQKEMLKELWNL